MSELKNLTLHSLLKASVEKYPDNPALSSFGETPLTYSQLGKRVGEVSGMLAARGITAGDRVAILSENKPNWGVAYFAITSMGAVAVPILPEFHNSEVQHIIRHSACKAIFISESLYEKIEESSFNSLVLTILIDNFSPLPPETKKDALREAVKKGSQELSRLKAAALKFAGKSVPEVKEDALACIIYTSGTTGHSKGVMLSNKNIVSNVISCGLVENVTASDRFLSILPLSHTYECTIGFLLPMLRGAAVYYFAKPPTPRLLMEAMGKIRPTMMLSVPLVIEKIYKTRILPQLTRSRLTRKLYGFSPFRRQLNRLAGRKLMKSFGGQIKFFGIGGALLAPDVEKFLREARFPYAIGYGLTETSPLLAGANAERTRFRSTGPAVSGVEIKINHPDPVTGEGEIWVRGDNVMQGYYKDPERTAEVLTKDGWFKTGDLGLLDRNNYLYIKGRVKNMIVGPSGENIYPEEIEAVFNEFDFVLESLVYLHNGKLTARIFLNYEELDKEFNGSSINESEARLRVETLLEELRLQVNERISQYSRIQKIIEQTDPFEKTPTQKTKRYLYVE